MLDMKALLKNIANNSVYETGQWTSGTLTWHYKIFRDKTFEAWCTVSGSTGTMTQFNVGGYSVAFTLNLPTVLDIKSIDSIEATCVPNAGYMMDIMVQRVSTTTITANYVRFGSNTAVSGLTNYWHIRGTLN